MQSEKRAFVIHSCLSHISKNCTKTENRPKCHVELQWTLGDPFMRDPSESYINISSQKSSRKLEDSSFFLALSIEVAGEIHYQGFHVLILNCLRALHGRRSKAFLDNFNSPAPNSSDKFIMQQAWRSTLFPRLLGGAFKPAKEF